MQPDVYAVCDLNENKWVVIPQEVISLQLLLVMKPLNWLNFASAQAVIMGGTTPQPATRRRSRCFDLTFEDDLIKSMCNIPAKFSHWLAVKESKYFYFPYCTIMQYFVCLCMSILCYSKLATILWMQMLLLNKGTGVTLQYIHYSRIIITS